MQKMDSIGQMTGGLAHDFNNMLGAIAGGADMLLTMPERTDEMEVYIELIRAGRRQPIDLKVWPLHAKYRRFCPGDALLEDALTLVERSMDKSVSIAVSWHRPCCHR